MLKSIGKFQLRKVLGKGASGTVYLALDTFSGNDVALKVLDPEVVASPEFDRTHTRQFMNEASLAGRLSHPHIASILEAAVTEESGYIAIEYVPGGDLSQYTSAERLLPIPDAIQVAFKCCGALDYAFRQGVIHRDIKPANIMVVSGTDIKIADFGAAFLRGAQETQIADVGSPLYMSPEQITGAPLGHQSDMFSLGVVLYELFTGERPFVRSTLTELFNAILHDDPVAPSALRQGLSQDIDSILMRMLKKVPEERYPTWADLALELARVGKLSVNRHEITEADKFVSLRNIAVFQELTDPEIWELVHVSSWTRLPARTTIMREDEWGDSLYFLAHGEVKITKRNRLLNILQSGEYFGEMAYVKAGAMTRQATAESVTDVLLAEFKAESLKEVNTNCRLQISLALLNLMVDRLALADERITRS